MMKKICKKCNAEKELSDFHKDRSSLDGHQRKCKACMSDYGKNRYNEKGSDILIQNGIYRKSISGVVAMKNGQLRHRAKYPEKRKARIAVANAIRDGKLVREPCEKCGDKAEAHHDSYEENNWLKVRWLCKKHHIQFHKSL